MTIASFLKVVKETPEKIAFSDTINVIEAHYTYTPTAFRNGKVTNEKGQNEGSCKLFAFAAINDLTEEETLACFGSYYRNDVLENPDGTDHANIRNFMVYGWPGIVFKGKVLLAK